MTTIYTMGYTGSSHKDLQAFVAELGAQLVDVRLSPRSRRPEWDGAALRPLLGERYTAAPELGNLNYQSGGPIKLANPELGVRRLRPILAERPVILLCACADWQRCHRLTAATHVAGEMGGDVVHLPGRFASWSGVTTQQDGDVWRVLSLTQPWASLVAVGAKRCETRSWSVPYRGRLAIHAAKRFGPDERYLCGTEPFRSALRAAGLFLWTQLPVGAIVATCSLVNCVPTAQVLENPMTDQEYAFGDYSPGRWAWVLEDVQALPEPVPAKGSLGLWSFPAEGLLMPV